MDQEKQTSKDILEYELSIRQQLTGQYPDESHGQTEGGIADLIGDLSAMFDERPAVEDCTTMPQRKERKKHDYEQSM